MIAIITANIATNTKHSSLYVMYTTRASQIKGSQDKARAKRSLRLLLVWYGMVWYGMVWYGVVVVAALAAQQGFRYVQPGDGHCADDLLCVCACVLLVRRSLVLHTGASALYRNGGFTNTGIEQDYYGQSRVYLFSWVLPDGVCPMHIATLPLAAGRVYAFVPPTPLSHTNTLPPLPPPHPRTRTRTRTHTHTHTPSLSLALCVSLSFIALALSLPLSLSLF